MKNFKTFYLIPAALLLLTIAVTSSSQMTAPKDSAKAKTDSEWDFNATIIEACSCPMFCQCYFNAKPASHHGHAGGGGEHFCKFNNAFKVNKEIGRASCRERVKIVVGGGLWKKKRGGEYRSDGGTADIR